MHFIEHIVLHTLEDTIHLIPFLFVVFFLLESIEHSFSHKTQSIIKAAGKAGPFLGGVLGALPQCGFSVMATNLFSGRVVTLGTLISVYLSTSDEMLAIMISHKVDPLTVFRILLVKTMIGIVAGFIIDALIRPSVDTEHIHDLCEEDHCDCEHSSPLKSAVHHTASIFLTIVLITLALNALIEAIGLEGIQTLVSRAGIFAPVLSTFVGLIPNCAASVVITELYLAGAITFGTALAGLLASSGVAWVILFRVNRHNMRENMQILTLLVIISILSGVFCNAMNVTF
ncbi:MAG: arsenic efflux protein [Firmicutes bacterium]|nr:arsenic efflux protein [Bacillota bacterium]